MGKKSRDKGAAFERLIVNTIAAAFPDAKVFRTMQADRAHQSDVHVAAGPSVLPRLWIECHHGKESISAKLQQAVGDAAAAGRTDAIPIVVWRRTRALDVNVTLHLRQLVHLRWATPGDPLPCDRHPVTMSIATFLLLVA
jgi:hypothetical protein